MSKVLKGAIIRNIHQVGTFDDTLLSLVNLSAISNCANLQALKETLSEIKYSDKSSLYDDNEVGKLNEADFGEINKAATERYVFVSISYLERSIEEDSIVDGKQSSEDYLTLEKLRGFSQLTIENLQALLFTNPSVSQRQALNEQHLSRVNKAALQRLTWLTENNFRYIEKLNNEEILISIAKADNLTVLKDYLKRVEWPEESKAQVSNDIDKLQLADLSVIRKLARDQLRNIFITSNINYSFDRSDTTSWQKANLALNIARSSNLAEFQQCIGVCGYINQDYSQLFNEEDLDIIRDPAKATCFNYARDIYLEFIKKLKASEKSTIEFTTELAKKLNFVEIFRKTDIEKCYTDVLAREKTELIPPAIAYIQSLRKEALNQRQETLIKAIKAADDVKIEQLGLSLPKIPEQSKSNSSYDPTEVNKQFADTLWTQFSEIIEEDTLIGYFLTDQDFVSPVIKAVQQTVVSQAERLLEPLFDRNLSITSLADKASLALKILNTSNLSELKPILEKHRYAPDKINSLRDTDFNLMWCGAIEICNSYIDELYGKYSESQKAGNEFQLTREHVAGLSFIEEFEKLRSIELKGLEFIKAAVNDEIEKVNYQLLGQINNETNAQSKKLIQLITAAVNTIDYKAEKLILLNQIVRQVNDSKQRSAFIDQFSATVQAHFREIVIEHIGIGGFLTPQNSVNLVIQARQTLAFQQAKQWLRESFTPISLQKILKFIELLKQNKINEISQANITQLLQALTPANHSSLDLIERLTQEQLDALTNQAEERVKAFVSTSPEHMDRLFISADLAQLQALHNLVGEPSSTITILNGLAVEIVNHYSGHTALDIYKNLNLIGDSLSNAPENINKRIACLRQLSKLQLKTWHDDTVKVKKFKQIIEKHLKLTISYEITLTQTERFIEFAHNKLLKFYQGVDEQGKNKHFNANANFNKSLGFFVGAGLTTAAAIVTIPNLITVVTEFLVTLAELSSISASVFSLATPIGLGVIAVTLLGIAMYQLYQYLTYEPVPGYQASNTNLAEDKDQAGAVVPTEELTDKRSGFFSAAIKFLSCMPRHA